MSDYPVTIPTLTEPDYSEGLGVSDPTHPEQHTLFRKLLAALVAKVGTDNSSDPTSIDSLLKNTSVGHHHDGIDSRAVAVGGAHPDLATHDALGLATDAELATHGGLPDAHHPKSHGHTGADGSGTVAHSATTGQTADDHHARDHHARHEPGGADAMAVDAAAATASLRTLGAGAAQAAAGNDARLSDARTPTAHETTHRSGGSDPLSHDNIAGVSADDHHAQIHHTAHETGGADVVAVTHAQTTGKTANDHHNQNHTDSQHTDGPNEKTANKGAASGYMGLDAGSRGAQSPKLHASEHGNGGADALALVAASFVTISAEASLSGETLFSALSSSGTNAARPAAGIAGRLYRTTDNPRGLWQDTGSVWIPAGLLTIRKGADETVTNSTTLQNDDDFLWTAAAGDVWSFQFWSAFSAPNTAMDVKVGWTFPTGATLLWNNLATQSAAISTWGAVTTATTPVALATESSVESRGSGNLTFGLSYVGVWDNPTNAGTIQMQWAQNTLDAGTLTHKKNSFLLLQKLAG